MKQHIGAIAILVRDYDEAISWYTEKLGFRLVEDTALGNKKRWVIVSPPGASEAHLLLAKAEGEAQVSRIGDQAGGRVFLLLHTDDFDRDHQSMQAKGVAFLETPRSETYGKVVVFEDLCGNRWDLIEPR